MENRRRWPDRGVQRTANAVSGSLALIASASPLENPPYALRRNRSIINARDPRLHQAVLRELPQLVSVRAIPLAAFVVPFILESYRHAILAEPPQRLLSAIVQFLCPLPAKQRRDLRAALHELCAVAPVGVRRVCKSNPLRVARVPKIFRRLHLRGSGLKGERRLAGQWCR